MSDVSTITDEVSGDLGLTVLPRRSLADRICQALQSRVVRSPPGARINVDEVARELGVSPTPVRVALSRLEADGLVTKTHLVGYSTAALPSQARIREMFTVRRLLEGYAAERAAALMTEEGAVELHGLAEAMETPAEARHALIYGQFAELDAELHRAIVRIGQCALIAEMLERVHMHAHLFRLLCRSRVSEMSVLEHGVLVAALTSGDPAAARRAAEEHLDSSLARLEPMLETLD